MVDDGSAPIAIPQHTRANLKRATMATGLIALGALAVSMALGHPIIGLTVLVGVALGAGNNFLVQRSVAAYGNGQGAHRRQRFVGGVFGRLAMITVIALGLAYLLRPDGFGVVGGLALFQMVMLVSAVKPMIRELHG